MRTAAIIMALAVLGTVVWLNPWSQGAAVVSAKDSNSSGFWQIQENIQSLVDRGRYESAQQLTELALSRDDLSFESVDRLEALLDEFKDGRPPDIPGLSFVLIPRGRYAVGTPASEAGSRPGWEISPREVFVSDFFVSTTEVTQRTFWELSMEVKGSWPQNPVGASFPAHSKTQEDGIAFCDQLSSMHDDFDFSLPTELEWEIACRAGFSPEEGPYSATGKFALRLRDRNRAEQALRLYANYGLYSGELLEVGSKRANPWGLWDMHGNVAEWCLKDPELEDEGSYLPYLGKAPIRGGSFLSNLARCRAGARALEDKSATLPSLGFRIIARPSTR